MFIYCECGWAQDDFWKDGVYSPLENDYFNSLKKDLLKGKIYLPVGEPHLMNEGVIINYDEKGFYMDSRDYVSRQLEKTIKTIRNMVIPTIEDWEKVKDNFKCPRCGKSERLHLD